MTSLPCLLNLKWVNIGVLTLLASTMFELTNKSFMYLVCVRIKDPLSFSWTLISWKCFGLPSFLRVTLR